MKNINKTHDRSRVTTVERDTIEREGWVVANELNHHNKGQEGEHYAWLPPPRTFLMKFFFFDK